jgi:hypothetical protein
MPTRPVPVTDAVRRLSEAMPKDICQGATDLIAQVEVVLAAQSQAQDSNTGLRVHRRAPEPPPTRPLHRPLPLLQSRPAWPARHAHAHPYTRPAPPRTSFLTHRRIESNKTTPHRLNGFVCPWYEGRNLGRRPCRTAHRTAPP